MTKKITHSLFMAICLLAFITTQKAIAQQSISWSTVALVDGTEVLTEGTLIEAINFSGGDTDSAHDTTINTVLFSGKASGAASGNAFANPTTANFESNTQNVVPFTVDQYDPEAPGIAVYDELLSRFLWNAGAGTVTISGLEVGKNYKLQFFMGDKRADQADAFIVIGVQGGTSYGSDATTTYAAGPGIVINGAFEAESTSFVLDLNKDLNGTEGFNLNAYQLREVASLGVDDASLINFNMYPNPASKSLQISLGNSEAINSKVTISNIAGQVVYTGSLDSKTKSIDVSNLNSGIYLVKVAGANLSTIKKLVIK
ncbi:T9SS type A sorting domain-containing protein [uncultured Algibacter sp.]|uniref:T9SS type A sorting domain-containing protein n=1 Tax=uncultured Algibacter sp. TaxID=298659 RepID=UPI00261F356E|nr:T9SS type A sorting domain-containing protein [uncultured Algibacter sp.]